MKEHNHDNHSHPNHHSPHLTDKDPLAEAYSVLKSGQLYMGDHSHSHHTQHPIESIRHFEYKGNKVVIKTNYTITVNDQIINPHVFVDNRGHLTTHALPNYSFNSAVDMIKSILDCMSIKTSKIR